MPLQALYGPGLYPQQGDCRVHSLNTGSVCWHQKKNYAHKHSCLFGGSEGEKNQESGSLGLIPVRGLAGEKLRVSWPEVEQRCEPELGIALRLSTSYSVSAQRFCPFQQAGELKPAACLLTGEVSSWHRWKIFPVRHSPGLSVVSVTGTAVTQTRTGVRYCGWMGAGHVWGNSPVMGCSVLRFKTVKTLQAQGAKKENFCSLEVSLYHPPAVHSLSHSAVQD